MDLLEFQSKTLMVEGIMGFNEEFIRELRVVINSCNTKILKIRGHGVMPLLTFVDRRIPFISQNQNDIIAEYLLLQKIYYFEIFKGITMQDDGDLFTPMVEEQIPMKKSSRTPTLSVSSGTRSSNEYDEIIFYRILRTYVFVYNNQDVPNVSVLEQLLETERFINCLQIKAEKRMLLNTVYQNYLQTRHLFRDKMKQNVKYFTIQPLPFQLRSRILDMGELYLDEYRKIVLELEFSGPGKLIACVRTGVFIPGLVVDLVDKDR